MTILKGEKGEKEALIQVAGLMLVSARTAPKTGGKDDIVTAVILGEEKEALAGTMNKIADERKIDGYNRDAKNVRDSDLVVLIGARSTKSYGDDCGGCGYRTCEEFEKAGVKEGKNFAGPTCAYKNIDLGIALCSAAKTADILNVDNRMMARVGTAARKLKLLPDADVLVGIPISAKGKSIYFDRKWPP